MSVWKDGFHIFYDIIQIEIKITKLQTMAPHRKLYLAHRQYFKSMPMSDDWWQNGCQSCSQRFSLPSVFCTAVYG